MSRFKPDFLFVATYWIVTVYLFYPGFMTNDSRSQLGQARAGVFTDAHPPVMASIWRFLDQIVPGPLLPLLLQVSAACAAVSIIAISLFPASLPRRLAVYSVLILPPVWGFIGVVWKDIWMQAALLLSFAVAIAASRSSRKSVLLAAAAFFLLLAAAFRHNAIAAVPPLVWAASLMISRRHVLAIALGIATTVLVAVANYGITKSIIQHEEAFSQVVWGFDIAGVSVQRGEDLFNGRYQSIMPQRTDINDIAHRYRDGRSFRCLYRVCNQTEPLLYQSRDKGDLREFRSNWISVIATYPADYLRHRIHFASYVLGIAGEPSAKTIEADFLIDPYFGVVYIDNVVRSYFRGALSALSATPIYSVSLYAAVSLIGIALAFGSALKNDGFGTRATLAAIGLYGSGLMYEFSVVAAALTPDFRYSLWMITCSWMGTCILLVSRRRREIS